MFFFYLRQKWETTIRFYSCPICVTSNHKLKWNQLSIKWANTIQNVYTSFVLCHVYIEAGRVEESHATVFSSWRVFQFQTKFNRLVWWAFGFVSFFYLSYMSLFVLVVPILKPMYVPLVLLLLSLDNFCPKFFN